MRIVKDTHIDFVGKRKIAAILTAYDDLIAAGSMAAAKQANHVRLEGKGYEVQDGDTIELVYGYDEELGWLADQTPILPFGSPMIQARLGPLVTDVFPGVERNPYRADGIKVQEFTGLLKLYAAQVGEGSTLCFLQVIEQDTGGCNAMWHVVNAETDQVCRAELLADQVTALFYVELPRRSLAQPLRILK